MTNINRWMDLAAVVQAASARLYVSDRRAERWEVIDVISDYGSETGQLILRHLGPLSRGGDQRVDIHRAYGYILPLIVYKPLK